jgi:hypothetical protein
MALLENMTVGFEVVVQAHCCNSGTEVTVGSQQLLTLHYSSSDLGYHCWLCYYYQVRVI